MAKNQNTTTTERPDIEGFGGSKGADLSSVLLQLWRHAGPALSDSELAWLAGAGDEVSTGLNCIKGHLENLACLHSDMELQEFRGRDALNVTDLLWPVVNQLDALASLAFISSEAVHRLTKPSLYRKGGLLHGQ